MTLLIVAKYKDGLILGADSRSVIEYSSGARFMSDMSKKLIPLNKYCCVMMAGDSQAGLYLINKFKKKNNKTKDIIQLSQELSKFCRDEYKPYINFGGSTNCPRVSFILAGLEKSNNKYTNPKIFVISSDTSFFTGEEEHYAIVGKDDISNYLFRKLYEECSVSSERMTELIVQCLYDTEKIDGEAGGDMHLASITEYGLGDIDSSPYIESIDQKDLVNIMELDSTLVSEDE